MESILWAIMEWSDYFPYKKQYQEKQFHDQFGRQKVFNAIT